MALEIFLWFNFHNVEKWQGWAHVLQEENCLIHTVIPLGIFPIIPNFEFMWSILDQ